MYWLDVCIFCYLLWGGAKAYIEGWKKSCWRLVLLWLSLVPAHLIKDNVKVVLTQIVPLQHEVQKVISSNLVIPVQAGSDTAENWEQSIDQMGLPEILKNKLPGLMDAGPDIIINSTGSTLLVQRLTEVFLNITGFLAAVMLCYAAFSLVFSTLQHGRTGNVLRENINVLVIPLGAGSHFLIVSMFAGFMGAAHFLYPPLDDIISMDHSVLARWGFELFEVVGLLW